MKAHFEMNGRLYGTDAETLAVLRDAADVHLRTGSADMVAAVMALGLKAGRIAEVAVYAGQAVKV
jgi:hypothetical protein